MRGYKINTVLIVHSIVDSMDFRYEKEFLVVAAEEQEVKRFFNSRSDTLGTLIKIEDRGPILVLL